MRGENPISFPVRLFPENAPVLTSYPRYNPRGTEIPDSEKTFYEHLPIVPITLSGDTLKASVAFMNSLPPGKGLSTVALEKLIHAGNFIVPVTPETGQLRKFNSHAGLYNYLVGLKEHLKGEFTTPIFIPETNYNKCYILPKVDG